MQLHNARKAAKKEAFWATRDVLPLGWKHDGESRIKLTIYARPAVRRDRDDDNLIAACKGFRDGIAQAMGVNDKLFELQPVVWGSSDGKPGGHVYFIVGSTR
jgi:hypothetical protein